MRLIRKVEIKGKEGMKGRGMGEKEMGEKDNNWRILMKLENNILTCHVSGNLDQGAQYFLNSLN